MRCGDFWWSFGEGGMCVLCCVESQSYTGTELEVTKDSYMHTPIHNFVLGTKVSTMQSHCYSSTPFFNVHTYKAYL